MVHDRSDEHGPQCLHSGSVPEPLLPVLHTQGTVSHHCEIGEVLPEEAALSPVP